MDQLLSSSPPSTLSFRHSCPYQRPYVLHRHCRKQRYRWLGFTHSRGSSVAIATLLFSIVPSGRMFGDRVRGKSRKYLASQTFTASYPSLDKSKRTGSIALWVLVLACKFVESYFYLTLSFSCIHLGYYVCGGSHLVLPRYFPLVHHLEHRLLYWPVFRVRPIDSDALEGYLCPVTKEDLRETAGYEGYGGQVQAKGTVYL